MSPRVAALSTLRTTLAALALCCAVSACKRAKRPTPPPAPAPAAPVVQAPVQSKEQAMAALLALPELKAWSAQIERRTGGKAHGAVVEDNPAPREVNGKTYYQLSFVENRAQDARRQESFLVAQDGSEILVDDTESDTLLSLQEWRRTIARVNLKSAD
jgi:hypothetical protein